MRNLKGIVFNRFDVLICRNFPCLQQCPPTSTWLPTEICLLHLSSPIPAWNRTDAMPQQHWCFHWVRGWMWTNPWLSIRIEEKSSLRSRQPVCDWSAISYHSFNEFFAQISSALIWVKKMNDWMHKSYDWHHSVWIYRTVSQPQLFDRSSEDERLWRRSRPDGPDNRLDNRYVMILIQTQDFSLFCQNFRSFWPSKVRIFRIKTITSPTSPIFALITSIVMTAVDRGAVDSLELASRAAEKRERASIENHSGPTWEWGRFWGNIGKCALRETYCHLHNDALLLQSLCLLE